VSADVERLVRVGSFLIGPPGDPLTSAKTIEFRRLDGVPLVLPSAPSAVRLLLDQLAKRARISLNVVMEADSTQIQKGAASHAGVYTVMPAHAVADELKTGRLQAARIVEPRIDRDIALGMTSARPASHASREIARLIRGLMTGEQARQLMGVPA
jgi:DNA-binding transcriptional LysR family regulator